MSKLTDVLNGMNYVELVEDDIVDVYTQARIKYSTS